MATAWYDVMKLVDDFRIPLASFNSDSPATIKLDLKPQQSLNLVFSLGADGSILVKILGENLANLNINNSLLGKDQEMKIDASTEIRGNDVVLKCEHRDISRSLLSRMAQLENNLDSNPNKSLLPKFKALRSFFKHSISEKSPLCVKCANVHWQYYYSDFKECHDCKMGPLCPDCVLSQHRNHVIRTYCSFSDSARERCLPYVAPYLASYGKLMKDVDRATKIASETLQQVSVMESELQSELSRLKDCLAMTSRASLKMKQASEACFNVALNEEALQSLQIAAMAEVNELVQQSSAQFASCDLQKFKTLMNNLKTKLDVSKPK